MSCQLKCLNPTVIFRKINILKIYKNIMINKKTTEVTLGDAVGDVGEAIERTPIVREIVIKDKKGQKHGVPAILSFFLPGLGQFIKGHIGKGFFFLLFTPLLYLFLIFPGLILHIICLSDAYNSN